ncbi:MAG: hypothetical protein H0V44_14785 [Planctomycetes bacterium]|nr:hypothetical protein [Planctomycetota bacterium]
MRAILLALLVCSGFGVDGRAADDAVAAETAAFFDQRIAPILETHCLGCHGKTRQKGRLVLNSREAILSGGVSGPAIVVGDPERSLLITAVRYQDPDLQMPPAERLADAQISDLVRWIADGAVWGSDRDAAGSATAAAIGPAPGGTSGSSAAILVTDPPGAATAATAATAPSTRSATAAVTAAEPAASPVTHRPPLIGRLHPLVIHFPIACLLLAVGAELLRWIRGAAWDPTVLLLVVAGTIGSIAAVVTGTWFAQDGAVFQRSEVALSRHEIVGWFTLTGGLISTGLLLATRSNPRLRWAFRSVLLLSAALAGLTGHFGGEMIYGADWLF